jgi:phosphate transport system protein
VNRYEREIDEALTLILARRHPAAIDLRMVIAMSKANTDLERIGDEAAKIAELRKRCEEGHLVAIWKRVILVTKSVS